MLKLISLPPGFICLNVSDLRQFAQSVCLHLRGVHLPCYFLFFILYFFPVIRDHENSFLSMPNHVPGLLILDAILPLTVVRFGEVGYIYGI